MSVRNDGPQFSEALYGYGCGGLGGAFESSEPDQEGKVSIWASEPSDALRERAMSLDIRNDAVFELQGLGFKVKVEPTPYDGKPLGRSLLCTNDSDPVVVLRMGREDLEIGLAERTAYSHEVFLSVRRSIGKGSRKRVVSKALGAIKAMDRGEHVPAALDSFLYESDKGGRPAHELDACVGLQPPRSKAETTWICLPDNYPLRRFDDSEGRHLFANLARGRYPKALDEGTGRVLVAYDLQPEVASSLMHQLEADPGQVGKYSEESVFARTDGWPEIAGGFRSKQQFRRDALIRALAEFGFKCTFDPEALVVAHNWADVYCTLNISEAYGEKVYGLTVLGLLFRHDRIEVYYNGSELVVPHSSIGGFGPAYALARDICRDHAANKLTEDDFLGRLPAGWRPLDRRQADDFGSVFGVGDYIGDGIWMTASGPADVGR